MSYCHLVNWCLVIIPLCPLFSYSIIYDMFVALLAICLFIACMILLFCFYSLIQLSFFLLLFFFCTIHDKSLHLY